MRLIGSRPVVFVIVEIFVYLETCRLCFGNPSMSESWAEHPAAAAEGAYTQARGGGHPGREGVGRVKKS